MVFGFKASEPNGVKRAENVTNPHHSNIIPTSLQRNVAATRHEFCHLLLQNAIGQSSVSKEELNIRPGV